MVLDGAAFSGVESNGEFGAGEFDIDIDDRVGAVEVGCEHWLTVVFKNEFDISPSSCFHWKFGLCGETRCASWKSVVRFEWAAERNRRESEEGIGL